MGVAVVTSTPDSKKAFDSSRLQSRESKAPTVSPPVEKEGIRWLEV